VSAPASGAFRHVPTIPYDPSIVTYTRFANMQEPHEFTDWRDESMSWKTTGYIGDWSPLIKLRVRGPQALDFFSSLAINSFSSFEHGQAKHAVFCNENGKVMGDGILMRHADDDLVFTSGPGANWAHYRFGIGDWDAECDVVTETRTIQQVQGPVSLALMQEVTGEDLSDIGFMRFRRVEIDGMPVDLLRQGMSGEIGFELHGNWDEGAAVWERIVQAGEKHGLRRLGGRTKMVNHVEASFPTPGVDYMPAWFDFAEMEAFRTTVPPVQWQRMQRHSGSYDADPVSRLFFSPVELGWGKSIRFDHDFVGAEALREEAVEPRRVLRTLVWDSADVLATIATYFDREGDPAAFMEWPRGLLGMIEASTVRQNGTEVGVAVSRCYSVYFREMLSLAVLDIDAAEPGTRVEVVWGEPDGPQHLIGATVARAPYKADNRRAALGDARPNERTTR
jgi:vanillate/3-O-methylgallate O-demethylase